MQGPPHIYIFPSFFLFFFLSIYLCPSAILFLRADRPLKRVHTHTHTLTHTHTHTHKNLSSCTYLFIYLCIHISISIFLSIYLSISSIPALALSLSLSFLLPLFKYLYCPGARKMLHENWIYIVSGMRLARPSEEKRKKIERQGGEGLVRSLDI